MSDHYPIDLIVVYYQHPQAAEVGLGAGLHRQGFRSEFYLYWLQWQLKPEGGTDLQLTLNPDLTTHGGDEFPADSQPQTGTAIAAGSALFDLAKGLKQPFPLILGNADTGIDDFKVNTLCIQGGNAYSYAASPGELDGIANQADQDLPYLLLVAFLVLPIDPDLTATANIDP